MKIYKNAKIIKQKCFNTKFAPCICTSYFAICQNFKNHIVSIRLRKNSVQYNEMFTHLANVATIITQQIIFILSYNFLGDKVQRSFR